MTRQFDAKVALITGGTSGIGKATAFRFAAAGAKVVVSGRSPERGGETVAQVKANGGDAAFILADVTQAESVKALVQKTLETFGQLDYAVNNAGVNPRFAPITEWDEAGWDEVIDTNLKGVWLCMKYEIPQILKQGGGAIVNTASVFGQVGFPTASIYIASKSGVIGLTKSAALEYAQQGIRINAVCPGVIATPLVEEATRGDAEAIAQLEALHPMKRLGKSEEVADAIAWLCSSQSSFVTGHTLTIDGGILAQ
ncbi:MAG: SDR family oxidoreductase [Leptolyngbyaceae cyanobacterium MO_188.B28]|nr:SDR family oxidoreductase [Leptolyngbyaceae cyanobacterium MO_188.B28]